MARGEKRGPRAHTIAGALLAASGAYLVVYWLPEVVGDRGSGASFSGTVDDVSSTVANFLTAHTGAFAIALAVIAALALGLALRPSGAGGR
jgi:cytochrome c-type biogenesis protein